MQVTIINWYERCILFRPGTKQPISVPEHRILPRPDTGKPVSVPEWPFYRPKKKPDSLNGFRGA